MSELAGWLQAIVSAGAIVVAIVLWRLDKRHAQDNERKKFGEHKLRLVNALIAEVQCVVENTDNRTQAINATIAAFKNPGESEVKLSLEDTGMPPPGSFLLSDAKIYNAAATQVGIFPTEITSDLTSFYNRISETSRLAEISSNFHNALESYSHMLPRIQMLGRVLAIKLQKYADSGCDDASEPKISKSELEEAARLSNYPLDKVMAEHTTENS